MDRSELAKLTKKERKAVLKEERKLQEATSYKQAHIKKWVIIISIIVVGMLGTWFLIKELSKPLPGTFVEQQGRDHVPQSTWEKFKYNSNPPTSGPHDAVWTQAGVYDSPQGDGHLVHSLEHGYIIISYNCGKVSKETKGTPLRQGYAGQAEETKECKNLKKQLADLVNEKGTWKLIVVPRPNLDFPIGLTAWTYIEPLNSFDKEKISNFIDAHLDHGPEKTMD